VTFSVLSSCHLFLLNAEVKQGSCEKQLFESFDLTQYGDRTEVSHLRGERSSY